MIVIDTNILIYSYRSEAPGHRDFREYFDSVVNGEAPFGVPAIVFSAFLRIVTNRRIYTLPSPIDLALDFVERVHSQPNCLALVPGPGHWSIFTQLCRAADARGNLVPDAYLAAMAIEIGAELVTADRGFGRWPGLRWRHPLDE